MRVIKSGATGSVTAALAATALLLAGCSSSSPYLLEHYLPEPAAIQSTVDCSLPTGTGTDSTDPSTKLMGRVPEQFLPVDVVRCTFERQFPSADSTTSPAPAKSTVLQEHLTGDYSALLAALAEPSDKGGVANCLDYGERLPELWLVNGIGDAVHIRWPLDNCGKSKPATANALAALAIANSHTLEPQEISS